MRSSEPYRAFQPNPPQKNVEHFSVVSLCSADEAHNNIFICCSEQEDAQTGLTIAKNCCWPRICQLILWCITHQAMCLHFTHTTDTETPPSAHSPLFYAWQGWLRNLTHRWKGRHVLSCPYWGRSQNTSQTGPRPPAGVALQVTPSHIAESCTFCLHGSQGCQS